MHRRNAEGRVKEVREVHMLKHGATLVPLEAACGGTKRGGWGEWGTNTRALLGARKRIAWHSSLWWYTSAYTNS